MWRKLRGTNQTSEYNDRKDYMYRLLTGSTQRASTAAAFPGSHHIPVPANKNKKTNDNIVFIVKPTTKANLLSELKVPSVVDSCETFNPASDLCQTPLAGPRNRSRITDARGKIWLMHEDAWSIHSLAFDVLHIPTSYYILREN